MMNTVLICTALTLFVSIFIFLNGFLFKKTKKLPPSPKGIPILGHIHLVGKNAHQDLQKLSKSYGPIMYLRFGLVDNIVVSSPQAAEQFLKTHDLNFASRPPHQASKYISYNQKDLAWSEYGPYWRNIRKLCTLELLSNHRINSFQSMRKEELCLLIESFKKAAKNCQAVDLSAEVSSMSVNMSCRMVFGKKYEDKDIGDKGFKAMIDEIQYLTAVPNLGDYFPFLGKLDFQGYTRRMKDVAKIFNQFFEKIIDEHEHVTNTKGGDAQTTTKDFVDTMLDNMKSEETTYQFTREHVKSTMLDMLVTSMDTSSSVIEWTMSELFRHPKIMKKVKEEIQRKVGSNRMVEEQDTEGLEYLEMVIKESLRIHPVAPLLIPHVAIKDCMVDGYYIPKNARVIVNFWAIGRDPNVWRDPEKFIPERFEGSNVDYRGRDFEFIPFGSGRRSCPGLQLGITVVRLVVAQLVHCFDWDLLNGMLPEELDMTEELGIVVSRAKHLMAIPKYRFHV